MRARGCLNRAASAAPRKAAVMRGGGAARGELLAVSLLHQLGPGPAAPAGSARAGGPCFEHV